MLDLIIKNAMVVDGTGRKPYQADIGIKGEIISIIDSEITENAKKQINGKNKIICPGFIDAHSHADLDLLAEAFPENKIRQGVTTEVAGHCGNSLFPVDKQNQGFFNKALESAGIISRVDFDNAHQFFERLQAKGIGVNYLPLTGHGTIRSNVMGLSMKEAENEEIQEMKKYLQRTFDDGARGISLGLEYAPGCFASKKELIELAKVAQENDGYLTVHLRNQDCQLIDSVEEIIKICRKTKVKTVFSHLKASGKENWGKIEQVLQMICDAKQEGLNISFDFYPYDASFSFLSIFLPPWAKEGDAATIRSTLNNKEKVKHIFDYFRNQKYSWKDVIISKTTQVSMKKYEGKTVTEIAKEIGKTSEETVIYILDNDPNIYALYISMSLEDIEKLVKFEDSFIGSDSFVVLKESSESHIHPRNFGTFPKVINDFVKNRKWLTLEEAVRKMTGLPAKFYNISKRGLIKEGYYADMIVFDLEVLDDVADYENPLQEPKGIEYVIINGQIQLQNNKINYNKIGKIL